MLRYPNAAAAAALILGGSLFLGHAAHAAPPCDGSSTPCSIDLGRASAHFGIGAAAYTAEAWLTDGSDASFSANPQFLPTLQISHGAGQDGFHFLPSISANVGGSGIQGMHEVAGRLQFTSMSFTAAAGYRITGLQAVLTGSYALEGNAFGYLNVPGAIDWTGQNFSATWNLDPAAADVDLSFTIATSYVEGEDGTALAYGRASASFDRLAFVVSVSPVPEPGSAGLLLLGAAALPVLVRRRTRR
jgi:hypothetical protein